MIRELIERYPGIESEELFPHFPRMPVPNDPTLRGYSWEDCHRGFYGAGGLILVSEIAGKLALEEGMRVLDLCCGRASSSIFLAEQYGVTVVALDLDVDPTENWRRVQAAGQARAITPTNMDARNILLPEGYFDAVLCLNSYFYFGTDDGYLPYLLRFLRAGGRIGVASPCYARELEPDTPREFLYDAPDFVESYAVHSPRWWRDHVEKSGLVTVRVCEDNPKGREYWLDDVRWLLEGCHPRDMGPKMSEMVLQEIVMLLTDQARFVTYLTLIAEKR